MSEQKQQHNVSQPTESAIQNHLHQLILSNWMRVGDEQASANKGANLQLNYNNIRTGIESIQSYQQLQTTSSPIERPETLSADVLLAKRLFGSDSQASFSTEISSAAGSSSSHLLLLFALLVLINLIVILGNILVILAVYATAKLRNVTNIFIVSLATADLLLGVLVLPYALMFEILDVWVFGRVWCRGWLVTDVWISTASILNLCAISVDRYVAVTRPVKYRSIMTPRRAKSIVAGVWIVSFLICFPPLLPQWNPGGQSTNRYKRQTNHETDFSLRPNTITSAYGAESRFIAQHETTEEPNLGRPNIGLANGFQGPLIAPTWSSMEEVETPVSRRHNAALVMVIDNELCAGLLCMGAPVKVAPTGSESRPRLDPATRDGRRLGELATAAPPLGSTDARGEHAFVSAMEMQSDMKSFLQGQQQQQHRSLSAHLQLQLQRQQTTSNGIQANSASSKLGAATQSLRSCKELEGRNILEALRLLTGCTFSPTSHSWLRNIIELGEAQFTSKDCQAARLCSYLRRLLKGAQFANQAPQNSKLKSPPPPHTKTKYKRQSKSERQKKKRKPSNGTTETNERHPPLTKCLMLLSLTAQDEMDSGCLLWPDSGCLRSSELVVVESTKLEARNSKSKLNPNSFRPREAALSSSGAEPSLATFSATQLDALLRPARQSSTNAHSGGRLLVIWAQTDSVQRLRNAVFARPLREQTSLGGDKDIDYWQKEDNKMTTLLVSLQQAICFYARHNKQLAGLRLLLAPLYCEHAAHHQIAARDEHPRGRVKRDMALSESRQKSGCALFDDKPYVIYSALGSFYIPMLIMIFFYSRIYLVASRAQKAVQRGYMTTKWPIAAAGLGSYNRYGPNAPERVTLRIHRRGQESGETLARDGSLIKVAASEQQASAAKTLASLNNGSNGNVSSINAANNSATTNDNNDDRQEPDGATQTVTERSDNPLVTSAAFALIESGQERRSELELINDRLEDNNEPSGGFHVCAPMLVGGRIADPSRQRHSHHHHHHHHQHSHRHHQHRHRHHHHHHHHHQHRHHRDSNDRAFGRHQHLKQRHCSCRHRQEGVAAVAFGESSHETLMRTCIVEEVGARTPVLPPGTSEISSARSVSSVQITVSQYDEDDDQRNQDQYQAKAPLLTVAAIKCERSQSVQVQDTQAQDSESPQKRLDRSHSCGITPTIVVSWNPESGCTTTKASSNEHLEVTLEESKHDQLNSNAGSQLSGLSMVANLPTQVRKQSMMLLSTISMRSSQTLRRLSMVASHPVDSFLKRSKSRDDTQRASSDSSCSNETDKLTIKRPKKTIDDFLMQVAGVDGSSEDEDSGEGEQENADDETLSEDSLHYSLLFGRAATPSPEDKPADKPLATEATVELVAEQRPSSGLQRKGAYYERATSRTGQHVDVPRQVGTSNQVGLEATGEGNIRRRVPKRTSRWHAKRLHAETKAAKTVAIIIGGFIFCWLPFFTAYLSRAIICERPDCIPQSLLSLFIWLGYLNSAINPVIYGLFSADFRHAFKNILCRCRFRNTDDTVVVSVLVDSIIKSIL